MFLLENDLPYLGHDRTDDHTLFIIQATWCIGSGCPAFDNCHYLFCFWHMKNYSDTLMRPLQS